MRQSTLPLIVVASLYLTVSTLDYQPPEKAEFEPPPTVAEMMESLPPPAPEFDLLQFVERRACVPLAELLERLQPLNLPAAVLSAGVEFVLSIISCVEVRP